MHPMLNTAVKAARKGAAVLNRASLDLDRIRVATKGRRDFVTEVDRAAEDAIVGVLRTAYPDHAVLAEESGLTAPARTGKGAREGEFVWIVDPLDGTTNYIHGFPQYAVSIGLRHRGVLTQAVVYDPTRNELFTATRGAGAFLNDRRIRVSTRTRMTEALIATGFPFRDIDRLQAYLGEMGRVIEESAGVRRAGAAALDLAYVACGRLDAFWEHGLKPWDVAAGSLLITEAGGIVSTFEGGEDYVDSGHVVCGTPKIHAALLKLLKPRPAPLPAAQPPAVALQAPSTPPAPEEAQGAPRRVTRVRKSTPPAAAKE